MTLIASIWHWLFMWVIGPVCILIVLLGFIAVAVYVVGGFMETVGAARKINRQPDKDP